GGQVSLNHDRAISTQASIDLRQADAITPYVDYLAVFLNRRYSDGGHDRAQLGLYATTVPSDGHRTVERREATYSGRDLTSILAANAFDDTYNIAQSTNYRTAVTDIIEQTDLSRVSIVKTDKTL